MCGRYIPNTEEEIMEIREILRAISVRLSQSDNEITPKNDDQVFPTDVVPVILMSNGQPAVQMVKWGFAKWDGKGVIINAKSENAASSRFFAPFINHYRCVIPAHGYYEWKILPDKTKIKFSFTNEQGGGIFMAGLYRVTDEGKEFVILTRQADENITDIHDRMPVMLNKEQLSAWLDGSVKYHLINTGNAYHIVPKAEVS
jgi:putative SOS response-associated peptidase YedK